VSDKEKHSSKEMIDPLSVVPIYYVQISLLSLRIG